MSEKIVQLNEELIKGQLKELVRGSVEGTLNELLERKVSPATISELNKKAYVRATVPCRAANIRMSMWTGSICGVTGAENLKMRPFW